MKLVIEENGYYATWFSVAARFPQQM